MGFRLIAPAELSPAEIRRWAELGLEAIEPNPFFEPEFVLAAAEALPTRGLVLLVVERGNDWTALVPLHRVHRWHRMPGPGVANWAHRYCFLGTPLVRPDGLDASLAELCRGMRRATAPLGFVGLDTIGGGGEVAAAFPGAAAAAATTATNLRRAERAFLTRREDGKYLALNAKRLRELRRQRSRLGEQLGGELECVEEANRPESVADFLELEVSGWKGREGTAFASIPAHARFFASICESFAARGRLQMLALRGDGRAAAMKCNLRAGDGLFCFKIAFDEQWTRHSPGILLELDNMDRFHRDPGLMWMDSCADPSNEMINRLWPGRRELLTIALTRPVAGSLSRTALRTASRARQALKGAK